LSEQRLPDIGRPDKDPNRNPPHSRVVDLSDLSDVNPLVITLLNDSWTRLDQQFGWTEVLHKESSVQVASHITVCGIQVAYIGQVEPKFPSEYAWRRTADEVSPIRHEKSSIFGCYVSCQPRVRTVRTVRLRGILETRKSTMTTTKMPISTLSCVQRGPKYHEFTSATTKYMDECE
jgi:hypothetical protein